MDHESFRPRLTARSNCRLLRFLRLPVVMRAENGFKFSSETGLLMYLHVYRLHSPNTLADMAVVFGAEPSTTSRIIKAVGHHIHILHSHRLRNLDILKPFFQQAAKFQVN
jgi:hypothetical protein